MDGGTNDKWTNLYTIMFNYCKTYKKQIQTKLKKMFKIKPTCCPGVGGLPPGVVSVETMLMQPERSKLINVGFGQTKQCNLFLYRVDQVGVGGSVASPTEPPHQAGHPHPHPQDRGHGQDGRGPHPAGVSSAIDEWVGSNILE